MSRRGLRPAYLLPITILAVLAFVLGVIYLNPGTGNSQTAEPIKSAPARIPADEPVARVASVLSPSVVQINVTGVQQTPYGAQKEEGIGSGVIYRSDGYIITNNHVVEGSRNVEVAFADGSTEQGQVVGTDPITDIAVVKVDRTNLPAASFSGTDPIVGQTAVAVGSPSGFESTVTSGIVSGTGPSPRATREAPSQTATAGLSASTSPICHHNRPGPRTSASPYPRRRPAPWPTRSSTTARPCTLTSASTFPT